MVVKTGFLTVLISTSIATFKTSAAPITLRKLMTSKTSTMLISSAKLKVSTISETSTMIKSTINYIKKARSLV